MTTETVEVERTVTDEENIDLCDYCGKEVPADDRITFAASDRPDVPELHFHESQGCLSKATLAEQFDTGPLTYADLEKEYSTGEAEPVTMVFDRVDMWIGGVAVALTIGGVASFAFGILALIGVPALGIGLLLGLMVVAHARANVTNNADEFVRRDGR